MNSGPNAELTREQRATLSRAEEAWKRKNFGYAISLFRKVLRVVPERDDVRERLHETQLCNVGGRSSVFRRLQTQCTVVLISPIIHRLEGERRLGAALDWAEACMTIDPTAPAACLLLANTACSANLPTAARQVLEFCRRFNPNDIQVLSRLAAICVDMGQEPDGLRIYLELKRLQPKEEAWKLKVRDVAAATSISRIKAAELPVSQDAVADEASAEGIQESADIVARRLTETTRTFRDMIRDKSAAEILEQQESIRGTVEGRALLIQHQYELLESEDSVDNRRKMAELCYKDGQLDRAIEWYEKSMDLGTPDPQVHRILMRIKCEKVESEIDGLKSRGGDGSSELVSKLEGDVLDIQLAGFEELLRMFPTDVDACFEYARLLALKGKYGEAIGYLQRARRNPRYRIKAAVMIADAFVENGVDDLAAQTYEEALLQLPERSPERLEVLYNLGLCYLRLEDSEKALELFKGAYQINAEYRDLRSLIGEYT